LKEEKKGVKDKLQCYLVALLLKLSELQALLQPFQPAVRCL
jgi:hypothetical protein